MAYQAGSRDKGGSTVDIYYFNHINEILRKGPSQIKTITGRVVTFEETAVESITGISGTMKSTTGIIPKSENDLKVGETRREGAQRECLEENSMMGLQGGQEVVVKTVEILF
ncbi:hypothetical protein B0H11DRAFT_1920403 [Mycena galericulata]|nr:hypothetical protein B0H11DRAFT_1920403 [Mycena galericulata]